MAVHHSHNCGETREYNYRPIRGRKITFSVKAGNNVAIALSADNDKDCTDIYEIFLGCWNGDESGVRRGMEDDILRVETPDILSADEFRSFWIKKSLGLIKVGKKGRIRPFLVFQDTLDNIPSVRYYGFSTGYGAEGDWKFGDERGDDSSSSSSSSAISSSDSEAEELAEMDVRPIMYKRPARWVSGIGGHMPHFPVSGGEGASGKVYVGMALHEGGHILGMVVPEENLCYIPFGGEAVAKEEYYVLGNPTGVDLKWKAGSAGTVPTGALQGGHSEDGEALYVGRVSVDGVVSCGKVQQTHMCCYVTYGGAEHAHRDYEVLCVKGIPCRIKLM